MEPIYYVERRNAHYRSQGFQPYRWADWNAGFERPVGPPRDHVYTAAEARERMERVGLRIEREGTFKYHYALIARGA
jgi:hypothetical protein